MESLQGYIATIVVSLVVGYLSRFLEPKSKLLCWSPHNFLFELKDEKVTLRSDSITIQNVGRRPAEEIEIIHRQKPDFFKFSPPVDFTEAATPNGEHVIRVRSLAADEWVFLQLLSYKTVPELLNVRWKHGKAEWIMIQPQRVYPKWVMAALNVLLLIGIGTILYWLIRAGIAAAGQFRVG